MSRMTGMTPFAPRRLAGLRMSAGGVFPAGNVTAVCLLIALSGVVPGVPLLIAANRDEMYQRPADPITVLRAAQPRILGGRDELAGGTWLAVNEHGVVAGLTNQPTGGAGPGEAVPGRTAARLRRLPGCEDRRDRGVRPARPGRLQPLLRCWSATGTRCSRSISAAGTGRGWRNSRRAATCWRTRRCGSRRPSSSGWPGWCPGWPGGALDGRAAEAGLAAVLRDHQPAAGPQPAGPGRLARPAELSAACVHTERYGTRSAMIVSVGQAGEPRVSVAAGPPCVTPLLDVTGMWVSPAGQPALICGDC